MSTPCDIGKEKVTTHSNRVNARNLEHSNVVNTLFEKPFQFLNWANSLRGEAKTEAEIQQLIADQFGDEVEVYKYAVPIMAMIEGSEMALHEAKNFLYGYSTDLSDIYEQRLLGTYKDAEGNIVKADKINLFAQPVPILKALFQKLRPIAWESLTEEQFNEQKAILKKIGVDEKGELAGDLSKLDREKSLADNGALLGHGILGKLRVQFLIPRKLAYREKTGAIWRMQNHINTYGPAIQNKINRFMSATEDRHFGITDIYKKLSALEDNMINETFLAQDNLRRLFGNLNRRRVIYVETEEQALAEGINDWDKPEFYYFTKKKGRKKDGKWEAYEDGSLKLIYQEPKRLSEYKPPNGFEGIWDVQLDKQGLRMLLGIGLTKNQEKKGYAYIEEGVRYPSLMAQYKQIDNEVFEAMTKEMGISIDAVLKQLLPVYNMDREDLKILFTSPDSERGKELLKIIEADESLLERHNFLMETFDGNFNIGRLEGVDFSAERTEHHFPAMFSPNKRRDLWENMISEKEAKIKLNEGFILKHKRKLEKKPSEGLKLAIDKLEKENQEYKDLIASHVRVLDLMDNMHEDKMTDTLITPFRENKYTKRVTNAFDDAASRFDATAYQDYLRHIFGTIERNHLTATMLRAFNDAESNEVRNIVANLYKLPFNRADIQSGILGWEYGPTALSKGWVGGFFRKFGIDLSPDDVNHNIRIMNNWLTAAFLNRPTSAITNMSAATQNIIDHGIQRTKDGFDTWQQYPEQWERLIAKSGLVDFSDYYSKALVDLASNTEIETSLAEEILAYQMRYWIRVEKDGSDKNKLKEIEILQDSVREVLEASTALGLYIDKIENLIPDEKGYLTPQRLAERKAAHKKKKILDVVNNLSNWAITKEYTMKQTLRKGPRESHKEQFWNDMVNTFNESGTGRSLKSFVSIYGGVLSKMGLTMANSEQFVRSLSFIIGVQHAIRKGDLPDGLPWAGWSKEEVDKAIEIGKTYSEWSNFQLSRGGMGQAGYAGLGLGMFKFKIWGHQKWDRDWDVIANAYRSMKDDYHIEHNTIDFGAIRKMLGHVFTRKKGYQEALRKSNPAAAQFRAYMSSQFIWTVLFDYMVLGPGGVIVGKGVPGLNSVLGRTLGSGASDLASFIFLPFLLTINILAGAMDEDEAQKTWFYYFRKTAFGFIPNWGMDLVFGLFGAAAEAEKHRANVFSPLLPGAYAQWPREKVSEFVFSPFDVEEEEY
tara:strand:+ start:2166 stop:5834 length:3669 start_codon:yes stop_codon:yes gene_type:complete